MKQQLTNIVRYCLLLDVASAVPCNTSLHRTRSDRQFLNALALQHEQAPACCLHMYHKK
jgi:hypothetical protein